MCYKCLHTKKCAKQIKKNNECWKHWRCCRVHVCVCVAEVQQWLQEHYDNLLISFVFLRFLLLWNYFAIVKIDRIVVGVCHSHGVLFTWHRDSWFDIDLCHSLDTLSHSRQHTLPKSNSDWFWFVLASLCSFLLASSNFFFFVILFFFFAFFLRRLMNILSCD